MTPHLAPARLSAIHMGLRAGTPSAHDMDDLRAAYPEIRFVFDELESARGDLASAVEGAEKNAAEALDDLESRLSDTESAKDEAESRADAAESDLAYLRDELRAYIAGESFGDPDAIARLRDALDNT